MNLYKDKYGIIWQGLLICCGAHGVITMPMDRYKIEGFLIAFLTVAFSVMIFLVLWGLMILGDNLIKKLKV